VDANLQAARRYRPFYDKAYCGKAITKPVETRWVQVIATSGKAKHESFKFKVEMWLPDCTITKFGTPQYNGQPLNMFTVKASIFAEGKLPMPTYKREPPQCPVMVKYEFKENG
jgi:hypothetical protein